MGCESADPMPTPGPEFDVQGNRGARGLFPENTIPAFEEALRLGVSTLELDVAITSDNVVVVTHDSLINPQICLNTNGTTVASGLLVRDITLIEVQSFDCGTLNNIEQFPEPPRVNVPGTQIPTLQEVFDFVAGHGNTFVRFNIETKLNPLVDDTIPIQTFVEIVIAVIQGNNLSERVAEYRQNKRPRPTLNLV